MTDTTLTAVEVNCTTGETTTRPLTTEEIAQREIDLAAAVAQRAAREAAEQATAAAKGAAQQKLLSLGLTAEEIAALTK
jgi:hypothetical protein